MVSSLALSRCGTKTGDITQLTYESAVYSVHTNLCQGQRVCCSQSLDASSDETSARITLATSGARGVLQTRASPLARDECSLRGTGETLSGVQQ